MELANQTGWRPLLALLPIVVTACGISPKPEPPDSVPVVNLGQVTAQEPSDGDPTAIEGAPGAADPPGALIRATNLDSQDNPVDAVVADDGSFAIDMMLMAGDEIRLQVIDDTQRSEPADFVVGPGQSPPLPAPRPLADCFTLSPSTVARLDRFDAVVAFNGCDEALTVEVATRRSAPGLSFGGGMTWPMNLAPGASVSIPILAPDDAVFEEVVFVRATAPETDRRPVTLFRP